MSHIRLSQSSDFIMVSHYVQQETIKVIDEQNSYELFVVGYSSMCLSHFRNQKLYDSYRKAYRYVIWLLYNEIHLFLDSV